MTRDKRICLGAFAGAHGVKGEAIVKTFTEAPDAIAAYGAVETEDGAQRFTLRFIRSPRPGFAIVRAAEIASREAALALKGERLYVARAALPETPAGEYYLDDLVGLSVVDETGAPAGEVVGIHNFGAGDILEIGEIPGVKGAKMIPLIDEAVPEIDLDAGRLVAARACLTDEDAE
ncbi:MAG: ribosome maturation factor RimM [Pseudomonadota bacterium]